MVDIGSYNADPEEYRRLVEEMYTMYPPITLPPEYSRFIQEDLVRLLIRLARYKFVARLLKKSDRVLEIGSGSGLGSMFLSQHCAHVTGIEVKASEVEEARSFNHRENVEFRVGDLFSLDEKEVYDVVAAFDVIEHYPEEEGRKLVDAMALHTKPTGMAVIGAPSKFSLPYQGALSQASHVKCYDREELIGLVERSFKRVLPFSMNDELVHTGHPGMAWYYFLLAFYPNKET